MTNHSDLLIVGGGLAAVNVIRALRSSGDQRSIRVLGEEEYLPYDRPPLSKQFLAGALHEVDMALATPEDWQNFGAEFKAGVRALSLHPSFNAVTDQEGVEWSGDDIVVATGARARDWHTPQERVFTIRTIDDALKLRAGLTNGTRLVIVGAGFIGLEVASTAVEAGCEVLVLESASTPLTRVLGEGAGQWFIDLHAQHGVHVMCGQNVKNIVQNGDHVTLQLEGDTLEADYVLLGIGVIPNVEWLEGSHVHIDDGVVCDESGRTSREHVWAVGDVARWRNRGTGTHLRVEQWQAAVDQAQVLAACLTGEDAVWESVPYFWSDQYGRKVQFAGTAGTRSEVIEQEVNPVVIFSDGDRATGLLAVDKPRIIALGRRVIANHGTTKDIRAILR